MKTKLARHFPKNILAHLNRLTHVTQVTPSIHTNYFTYNSLDSFRHVKVASLTSSWDSLMPFQYSVIRAGLIYYLFNRAFYNCFLAVLNVFRFFNPSKFNP